MNTLALESDPAYYVAALPPFFPLRRQIVLNRPCAADLFIGFNQLELPQRPPVAEIEPGRKSPCAEISEMVSERRLSKSNRESDIGTPPQT